MLDPVLNWFFDSIASIAEAKNRKERFEAIAGFFLGAVIIFGSMVALAALIYWLLHI